MDNGKTNRILGIYTELINGRIVHKDEEAKRYGVNLRSIQRDIDDIREYFEAEAERSGFINSVIYDRHEHGYKLDEDYKIKLSNGEVFAVCKILLESRAFSKKAMQSMLDCIINSCVPKSEQNLIRDQIHNEEYHYIETRNKSEIVNKMWAISQAIQKHLLINIDYLRTKDKKTVNRTVEPLAILFSEYYFYLLAFIPNDDVRKDFDVINDSSPTIYRIDRIQAYKVLKEKFYRPYKNRFEEGEFRKRVQFMYGGKLQKIKFVYKGPDVDAVLDRIPTAEILEQDAEGYTIGAEVFGTGIDMWIRSQGDNIEIKNTKPIF